MIAHRYGNQPLTVDFIKSLHRAMFARIEPEFGGKLAYGNNGLRGILDRKPLNDTQRSAIRDHPLLTLVPAPFAAGEFGSIFFSDPANPDDPRRSFCPLHEPLTEAATAALTALNSSPVTRIFYEPAPLYSPHDAVIYPRYTDPEAALQQLCDSYEEAKADTAHDPYELAGGLQQAFIFRHLLRRDFSGRVSRLLMNWSLRNDGVPPSALPDFDADLCTSPAAWAASVRAGSELYGSRLAALARDPHITPVTLFGLARAQVIYQAKDGPGDPFDSLPRNARGMHDMGLFLQLLSDDDPAPARARPAPPIHPEALDLQRVAAERETARLVLPRFLPGVERIFDP